MEESKSILTAMVVKIWRATDVEPIGLQANDIVRIGRRSEEWPGWVWCTGSTGKGCWVPESLLVLHDEGLTGWLVREYSPMELNASPGEQLILYEELSGWWWASNACGETGWIPASHLGDFSMAEEGSYRTRQSGDCL
jgi:hypothetical protein